VKTIRHEIRLGDLISAVFDEANDDSVDPKTVSHVATLAILNILRGARWEAFPSFAPSPDSDQVRR
jgi:hypothetical protein